MAKTNIEHLRKIISASIDINSDEAFEFLDAIEQEIEGANEEVKEKKEKIEELEQQVSSFEEDGVLDYDEYNVGLDTIYLKLHHGNLKIQQEVEGFIKQLQVQNSVVPV